MVGILHFAIIYIYCYLQIHVTRQIIAIELGKHNFMLPYSQKFTRSSWHGEIMAMMRNSFVNFSELQLRWIQQAKVFSATSHTTVHPGTKNTVYTTDYSVCVTVIENLCGEVHDSRQHTYICQK